MKCVEQWTYLALAVVLTGCPQDDEAPVADEVSSLQEGSSTLDLLGSHTHHQFSISEADVDHEQQPDQREGRESGNDVLA